MHDLRMRCRTSVFKKNLGIVQKDGRFVNECWHLQKSNLFFLQRSKKLPRLNEIIETIVSFFQIDDDNGMDRRQRILRLLIDGDPLNHLFTKGSFEVLPKTRESDSMHSMLAEQELLRVQSTQQRPK